jgi:hypothetical protein
LATPVSHGAIVGIDGIT